MVLRRPSSGGRRWSARRRSRVARQPQSAARVGRSIADV